MPSASAAGVCAHSWTASSCQSVSRPCVALPRQPAWQQLHKQQQHHQQPPHRTVAVAASPVQKQQQQDDSWYATSSSNGPDRPSKTSAGRGSRARKQQQPQQRQQQQQQPDSDSDSADDRWYTSSSSSSSSSSSGNDTTTSGKRVSSSSGSTSGGVRSRFRRPAGGASSGAAAGRRSARLGLGSAKSVSPVDDVQQPASSSSTDTLQQQQVPPQQEQLAQDVQQQLLKLAVNPSSSSSSSSSKAQDGPALSSHLPAHQVQQLHSYLDHLLEVNKVMNLTAIRDPDEAWERHIEDSLALLPVIEQYACSSSSSSAQSSTNGVDQQQQQQRLSVIDVGTGAGLPGMVLAIVRPDWEVTLLDSLRKRCDFLEGTAKMLGLRNVRVVWSRAEDGGRDRELRDGYDVAVARAVAELRVLSELCLPFVRPGGWWVAAKGADPEAEVTAAAKAVSKLRGQLAGVPRVQSWAPEGQRTAVVVRKTGATPQLYPRAPGTPSKKPL